MRKLKEYFQLLLAVLGMLLLFVFFSALGATPFVIVLLVAKYLFF